MATQSKRQAISSPITIENYPSAEISLIDVSLARKIGVNAALVFHQLFFQHNYELKYRRQKFVDNGCWIERPLSFWLHSCSLTKRSFQRIIKHLKEIGMIESKRNKYQPTYYKLRNSSEWNLPDDDCPECDFEF